MYNCKCGRKVEFTFKCRVCGDVCEKCKKTGGCHVSKFSKGNFGQGYSGTMKYNDFRLHF